jgi:hypothetical protein
MRDHIPRRRLKCRSHDCGVVLDLPEVICPLLHFSLVQWRAKIAIMKQGGVMKSGFSCFFLQTGLVPAGLAGTYEPFDILLDGMVFPSAG